MYGWVELFCKNSLGTEIELILPLYDDLASGMVSTNTVDATKTSMIDFSDCHIFLGFHKKGWTKG